MKKARILLVTVMAVSLAAFAYGCGEKEDAAVKGDVSDLSEGALAEVEVEILEDGTLYAVEIGLGDYEAEEDAEEGDVDEDGDDDFEEQFTAPVEEIADDFSYIVVFGGLTVMLDLEDDDEDEDDEDGDEGELSIKELAVGMWVTVEGIFGTDEIFHADEILAADEKELELGSRIGNLTASSFEMLGMTITFDQSTEVEIEDAENEDDEDEDDEDED